MIIDRNLKKYVIFSEDPIIRGLEKMDQSKMRVIFVVNENGMLQGLVTDGDVRRWLMSQHYSPDLNTPLITICNKQFEYCLEGTPAPIIKGKFSQRIEYIPLVDEKMNLKAIATERVPDIYIGNRKIAEHEPCFVIAEIGNNHNGSLQRAIDLIDAAADSGADCAKFQLRNMKKLYNNAGNPNDAGEDLGSQYVLDLLSKYQLKEDEMVKAFEHCLKRNIIPLCTPWDIQSAEFLHNYGVEAFKIASADFTNHELMASVVRLGRVMICSTGMCTEQEVKAGTELLINCGAQFILLHCNSTYPSPFKDINLNYINRLKQISPFPIGYSGHERGIQIALAAVTMGAKVIEKHFTFDRSMEGNDHKVSLLPHEFKDMVEGIRTIEMAMEGKGDRTVSQGELINRETLAKSLVANAEIKEGEIITEENITVRSPGKGLAPYRIHELVGKMAVRNIHSGDYFYEEDISGSLVKPRKYSFAHPYGIPVRYHDLNGLASLCPMDLIEIHLSYKDLDLQFADYLHDTYPHKLVVHSPELFSGDHIMNLCSRDEKYRYRSISELQRVINVTRQLKKYFPNSEKPPIVINVGGFSADRFLLAEEKNNLYQILIESLAELDQDGIELIPQTMPPFPWHFGGQRFHNLFVDSSEIVKFCSDNNYRVCFDISHSKLACNYNKISFSRFIDHVSPYTAHMHISDAAGIDGEGLQIHEGEIDFGLLMSQLKQKMPKVSFIPEIWQGHKNNGHGFWLALQLLEQSCKDI